MQDTGPAGACLGSSFNILSLVAMNSSSVKITYGAGDVVDTTPRQVDVYINCDNSASILDFANFIPAQPQNPPPPFYLFSLYLKSSMLCPSSSSLCPVIPGFDFDYIAMERNYQYSWVVNNIPQKLTYAPCSSGVVIPCGSTSSQCTVCQSWGMGNTACLGLSTNLLSVTVITPVTVKITYGGGDPVGDVPRQVDIYISCDPAASRLSFVKFIEPTGQNPPPTIYLYQLFLSSNTLCTTQADRFLNSLGIQYP